MQTKSILPNSKTVDKVAEDQGVAEPVEEIVERENGAAVVGGPIPSLPRLLVRRWEDAFGLG